MKKLALLLLAFTFTLVAADIDGPWRIAVISFGEEINSAKLELKVQEDHLSGTLNELKIEGTFKNGELKFTASRPNGDKFATFEGRVNGNELSGTARRGEDDLKWIATRKVVITAAPQIRTFEPTQFHRYFS